MKKREIGELHNKKEKELLELIKKAQAELVQLRIDFRAGRLKDIQAVNKKRREIARLKTILKELEFKR